MFRLRKISATASLLLLVMQLFAQGPNSSGTYYKAANGRKGEALKTALCGIISSGVTNISYDGLLKHYEKTDRRADGKVWDMYSNTTNFSFSNTTGNYKKEGDIYNREHSMPQSWFKSASPMKSDIVHVVPTDGYVNNRRSSYPYGETDRPTYQSANGFSKLGPCSVPGYSGTVFEPNDEYKGDFARIYFYMATRYEKQIAGWAGNGSASAVLAGNSYPAYKTWFINMLLRWAKEDPVSQKEIDRNNAVYNCQHNRNPFVDYPGLEQYVWGDKQDVAFSYDNYDGTNPNPDPTPDPDPSPDPDPDPDPSPDPTPDPTPGDGVTFEKVASADGIQTGTYYILVFEGNGKKHACALSDTDSGKKYFTTTDVDIAADNTVTTSVGEKKQPHQLLLGGRSGDYTFYDALENGYLTLTSSANNLQVATAADTNNAKWSITVSGGKTSIWNNAFDSREIQYNAGSPRFACYTSSQQPVSLYRKTVASGIAAPGVSGEGMKVNVYSVTGVAVRRGVSPSAALDGLKKGVYILNGRKFVVE